MENYNELYHAGVKGMKWGVRRYQNADGSLTDAGRKRYARDAREKEYDKYDESTSTYYKDSKKNGRSDLQVDADRYVKEDISRTKKLTEETNQMARNLKNINDTASRNKPKTKMDLSHMSDKEMRDAINREYLERQYSEMFGPSTVSKGRENVSKTLEVAGSVLTVTATALGIALAIRDLKTGKVVT